MRLSLGIVAPDAYPTLAGLDVGTAGGAEEQQVSLAVALAKRGHEISLVAGDYGQARRVAVRGVVAERSYKVGYGNRILRYPGDSVSVFRAMQRCGARIFLQRCAFHQTGRAWAFSRLLATPFVFSAGADMNAWPTRRFADKPFYYTATYAAAIRAADLVLCQNATQQEGFRQYYGRDAVIVPNIVDTTVYHLAEDSIETGDVLWVGRLTEGKRPDAFLDLVEDCPDLHFVMIAQEADPAVGERVRSRVRLLPNLDYRGFVRQTEMAESYRKAQLLVSTSSLEGLPNVLLQAMASGVPVVSLELDPACVLSRSGAGRVCQGSQDELSRAVHQLAEDRPKRLRLGQLGRAYVTEHHSVESVIHVYEDLLMPLMG